MDAGWDWDELEDDESLPLINVDEGPYNADWTKQSWDITGVDTVEKLREYIARQGMSVEQFKRLPVYVLNVNRGGMEWLADL